MALSINSEYITSDRCDHLAMRIPGGWITSWQPGRLAFDEVVAALRLMDGEDEPEAFATPALAATAEPVCS